ncbi:MAG: hypothetical protein N3D82_00180 [Ignisphaera sp.]|nr:hypothetical protein [Ignisphaera sp.]MCX8167433.1 hypothetical protein [Ignisphaera sp.]MDW8084703.1 hypothetical protein [Ignisphaera sp.]
MSSSLSRDELIDIITYNNMVEEFVAWLRNVKGISADPISLKDIDYNLLLEFARSKGLLNSEAPKEFTEINKQIELYNMDVKRSTKPKKIRRKT